MPCTPVDTKHVSAPVMLTGVSLFEVPCSNCDQARAILTEYLKISSVSLDQWDPRLWGVNVIQ